ncbi:MAG: hypothetical protein GY940_47220, partial [bacterium]|nr:hypothetical protein [bacterium]
MTKLKVVSVLGLLFLFGWGITVCNSQGNETGGPQTAALETLEQIKQFPPEVLKQLGFKAPQTVREIVLGNPLNAFIVKLDRLETFQPADDPHNILEDVKETGYPLYSGASPVSS